jgi:glycerol-3-phosphate dehydrogenase (NAD(P)+)
VRLRDQDHRTMTVVTMLGAGVMASALSMPLSANGHAVRLVGTHLDREIIERIQDDGTHPVLHRALPADVTAFQLEQLADAVADAEIIVSGVNSFGVRWAGEQLARALRPEHLVLSLAKGMDADEYGELRILTEVLADPMPPEVRDVVPWSTISGPSIAGEVAAERETCVLFSGPDQCALDRMADVFRTGRYHVWTSTDLIGAEVSASMKNCYALGVGLAEGVLEARGGAGDRDRIRNFEAALFAQGAIEIDQMAQLLRDRSGLQAASHALASVGDLYATSALGRNREAGRLVGTGMPFEEAREQLGDPTLEGAAAVAVIGAALRPLTERRVIGPEDFPLVRHLHEVIVEDRPLRIPWGAFFGGER